MGVENEKQYNLYATLETRLKLGSWLCARVPEIAGMDVIVISRSDIEALRDVPVPELTFIPDGRIVPHIFSQEDYKKVGKGFKEVFNRVANDLPSQYSRLKVPESTVTTAAENLSYNSANTLRVYDIDDDGKQDLGIFVIPEISEDTNLWNISQMSNQPKDILNDHKIPSGYMEGVTFLLGHEARHLYIHRDSGNDKLMDELSEEIDADQVGLGLLQEGVERGVIDPRYSDAIKGSRLMGSLRAGGEGVLVEEKASFPNLPVHSTYAYLIEGDEVVLPVLPPEHILDEHKLQGQFIVNGMVKALTGTMRLTEMQKENEGGAGGLQGKAALYFRSSDKMDAAFDDPETIVKIGRHEGYLEPLLNYAVVKEMEKIGAFKGIEPAEKYIGDLDAFYAVYVDDIATQEQFVESRERFAKYLNDGGDQHLNAMFADLREKMDLQAPALEMKNAEPAQKITPSGP